MRIAAVVGDYPVVSKTFVTDQLLGLLRAGHDVSVLARPPQPTQALPPDGVPAEVQERVLHRPGAPTSKTARTVQAVQLVARSLVKAPRPTWGLLTEGGLTLARRRRLLHVLDLLVLAGEPDVVHCHFGVLGPDVVEVRDRLGWRSSVVTSFHGFDISRHVERHGPDVFADLFTGGDLFLPVSEHWRQRLLSLGAPADLVQVQHMGIDLSRFQPTARTASPGEPLHVLSVCRLVEKKGLRHGVDAVALLRERGVPVRWTIVGDGPERPVLERHVQDRGVEGVVAFAGARERSEVRALLTSCDVLLCPSVTASDGDSEGIPMILMEAMATAVPVVSSWHSGIPELVEHGVSGLLAPERDDVALADHLERLRRDRGLARRLGSAGRAKVEQEFDLAHLVDQLAERLSVAVAARRAVFSR